MRRKMAGIGLLIVMVMFLLVLEPIPVHAASSIVQQNNGGCASCASTTLAVAFSSPVASGNVVVVGIEAFGGGGSSPATDVTSLVDSLGSSYTQAVTSSDGNNYVYIYYATLSSSGSDTVTATFGGIRTESAQNVYIYEVSGVVPTGATVGNNAGSGPPGSSISTSNPVSFPPGAFLLGVIGIDDGHTYPSAGMTVSPGAGFTLSPDNGLGFSHAQYAISGVSSPTNFPATITNPSSNYYWAEASLALYNRDCCTTVTTTSSASTSTTSSTSTTTTFATGTTSTTLSEITNSPVVAGTTSVTSTVSGPTAGTATTTYTSILSTSTTTSLTTSTVNETTTETGVTTVGTDTSTTTSTGTTFSSTTSGETVMVTETDTVTVLFTTIFQELHQLADEFLQLIGFQPVATPIAQEVNQVTVTTTAPSTVTMTVSYSIVGGGSPTAPVFHYVLNGAAESLTLSKTSTALLVDAGTTWSVTPNPLGGSSSSQRWYSNQPLTGTASSTTLVFVFYRQILQTLSYSVRGGGSGYSAPSFQANQFGSPFPVTLTKTAARYWFDYGSSWTVGPNPLVGSTSTERWLTTQATTGSIAGIINSWHAFTFQHQFYLTMQASPSGAGSVNPSSSWYNAGQKVTIKATAKSRHGFLFWSGTGAGSYTGTSATATITMNSAITETADFRFP